MMKRILILAIPLILTIAACNPLPQQLLPTATVGADQLTAPPLMFFPVTSPPTITPESTPVPQPTAAVPSIPAASPTAVFSINRYKLYRENPDNLYKLDLDIEPPIRVSHNPALIARSDETVRLEFDLVCAYVDVNKPGGWTCNPQAALFVSYGGNKDFAPFPLPTEKQDGLRVWVAHVPATNESDLPLRYYLRISDPKIDLAMSYPLEGAIEMFAASDFIPVELPAQKAAEPGELALALPWGSGPQAVGIQQGEGYPRREGPAAIAVSEQGKIALLDHVNGRVLIYDPQDQGFNHIPLPFVYKSPGDTLQFDRDGQLGIFDPFGGPVGGSRVNVPRLYRLSTDGIVEAEAPVFAASPSHLRKDLAVFDYYDFRWVKPFGLTGEVNSREAQRLKQNPELPYRFVEHQDPYVARFGDAEANLAFEVRSASPLGAIALFEKTPQGYIALFAADQLRSIWFDPTGKVLKDVTLPHNDLYSEMDVFGQYAIDQQGSLYVLGSTEKGIEAQFVKAP
jgi:hypothetical protein